MPVAELKNGIHLQYEEYGEGKRYLLCAQDYHSKIDDYTIELSHRGFHVFNITIRGYGQSTHVTEDYGEEWYNIWADDVVLFADAMGIEKFFYTGVSHGGGIGWTICVRHPERLIAYLGVVAGPHSKDGKETGSARMGTILAAETPETWKAYVEKQFSGPWALKLNGSETEEEAAVARAKHEESYRHWLSMTKEEAVINPKKPFPKEKTEEELIAVLSKIQVPTLLLGGMHDDICLPENLIRSCRAVKNAKLVIYEAATHGLSGEHKMEICDDIVSFCKQRKLF